MPIFSATKIHWILENVPGAREKAQRGELMFGTVDTWLLYKLTGGKVHATDYTNASRTMMFNIHTGEYDGELLDLFEIPLSMLPEVRPSGDFGKPILPYLMALKSPIGGIAGDQQAALFGHGCFSDGMAKKHIWNRLFYVDEHRRKPSGICPWSGYNDCGACERKNHLCLGGKRL